MKKIVGKKNKAVSKKLIASSKISNDSFKKNGYFGAKVSIGPFLAATFIAIFIGVFLGLMMLNMFAEKEDVANDHDQQSLAISKDEDVKENTDRKVTTTLKQMSAFVIQLGVFSELENADEWSKTYEQAGFPSTTFQRDNQYFLFTGVANSEERAKEIAEDLSNQDIEVYVKEWITNEKEIELTDEESKWIQLFQEQWQAALSSLSTQEDFSFNDWKNVIEDYPQHSDEFTPLVNEIQRFFESEAEEKNVFSLQNELLQVWKTYEEIFILK